MRLLAVASIYIEARAGLPQTPMCPGPVLRSEIAGDSAVSKEVQAACPGQGSPSRLKGREGFPRSLSRDRSTDCKENFSRLALMS